LLLQAEAWGALWDEVWRTVFQLHQTADVAHASVWRELIDKELAASPEARRLRLMLERRAAKALWCSGWCGAARTVVN